MRVLWHQAAGVSIGEHFEETVSDVLNLRVISPIEIIFPLTMG
jgi:hypothetical protein